MAMAITRHGHGRGLLLGNAQWHRRLSSQMLTGIQLRPLVHIVHPALFAVGLPKRSHRIAAPCERGQFSDALSQLLDSWMILSTGLNTPPRTHDLVFRILDLQPRAP